MALSTAYEYYSSLNKRQGDSERMCSPEIKDTYNEKNILLQSVSSKNYDGGMDEMSRCKHEESASSKNGEEQRNHQNNGKKGIT